MDTLYFAFANDPDRPLEELKREDAEISRILEQLDARGYVRVVRDSFVSLDDLGRKLDVYKRDLVLFHFSGHAGDDRLQLEDGEAFARGIARMLGNCPRLQLVVLNGCATARQVALLQDLFTPAVIATHRPVEDPKASAFAIQFYRTLAQFDTLGAAFEAASGRVQAMDAGLEITRGVGRRSEATDRPAWGLFTPPGREDMLEWRLPQGVGRVPDDYEPNVLLIDTLMEALGPYRPEIARIVRDEEMGVEHSILNKRRVVLEALPHPISEQIRELVASGSDMTFFDQPGLPRLQKMNSVYDTTTGLMAFIMLAQLWDALQDRQEGAGIPEDTRQTVRRLLLSTSDERRQFDFIDLTRAVRVALDEWQVDYFVQELKDLRETFQEGKPFFEACRFFAGLKPRLATIGENEAVPLSVLAEQNLSRVLGSLGFVARYTISSVKNIDVIKNRHQREPSYKHIMVQLVQRFVGMAEEPQLMAEVLDSSSVLLMREDPGGARAYLNLTPFIIDENAFDDKAKVAKLHYFERYLPEQDAYAYRHIYMPGDLPLVVSQQKHFKPLKAQFDTFARLLFNQPMRDAV